MKYLKNLIIPLLIFIFIFIIFYQPQILEIPLIASINFPVGTLISWLLIILIPLFFFVSLTLNTELQFERILKSILKIDVFVGLVWGIISYMMAGNWNYEFSDESRMFIWMMFTAFLIIVPFLIFLIWGFLKLK